MKLRKSLPLKITAAVLITMLGLFLCVGGYVFLNLLANEQITRDQYVDTIRCFNRMSMDTSNVTDYFDLYVLSQQQELTAGQQNQMDSLKAAIGGSDRNFIWQVLDSKGNLVISNMAEGEGSLADNVGETFSSFAFDQRITVSENAGDTIIAQIRYNLHYGLREGLPYEDDYRAEADDFLRKKDWLYPLLSLLGFAFAAALALYLFLAYAAGHKEGQDGIVLNGFDKIWTEVHLLLLCAALALLLSSLYSVPGMIISLALVGLWALTFGLSLIRKLKAKAAYRTSLLHLQVRLVKAIARHTSLFLKTMGLVILFTILQLFLFISAGAHIGFSLFWLLIINFDIGFLVVWAAIQYKKIRQVTDKMAEGDLDAYIDPASVPVFSKLARNVNSTQNAIQIAVQNATRSERMKTELITNVSHDIKTPLTSIISYVDLLKNTQIEDPKALEYIGILEKKSKRLAQLMADLVEASKVTSGNIAVNLEPLNISELIKQAGGEFESRLEERNIQLLCRLPDHPVTVLADGRHMWRVLDNLFGNAVKYALDGTRVYVDLLDTPGDAIISIKNISREALNIQPDELTERFVRGDSSRYTEGSGLGLSIAKSLMELQHGVLNIQIDGDLFKVILFLKKVDPPTTLTA